MAHCTKSQYDGICRIRVRVRANVSLVITVTGIAKSNHKTNGVYLLKGVQFQLRFRLRLEGGVVGSVVVATPGSVHSTCIELQFFIIPQA